MNKSHLKTFLLLLLAAMLLLGLAACGGKKEDDGVTPTDLQPTDTREPEVPLEDEEMQELITQLSDKLGITFVVPEGVMVHDSQVGESSVKLDIIYKEINFNCTFVQGLANDVSGLGGREFEVEDSATYNGISMKLLYPNDPTEEVYFTLGVAEGYDAGRNVTISIVQGEEAQGGELLREFTQLMLEGLE